MVPRQITLNGRITSDDSERNLHQWQNARHEGIHRTQDTKVHNTREGGRQEGIKLKDCFFLLVVGQHEFKKGMIISMEKENEEQETKMIEFPVHTVS